MVFEVLNRCGVEGVSLLLSTSRYLVAFLYALISSVVSHNIASVISRLHESLFFHHLMRFVVFIASKFMNRVGVWILFVVLLDESKKEII